MLCADYDNYQEVKAGLKMTSFIKGRHKNGDISRTRNVGVETDAHLGTWSWAVPALGKARVESP